MIIILLSGGVDSAVLLAKEVIDGKTCHCLSFDYNQRHKRELLASENIANHYGVSHTIIKLPADILAGSALTGKDSVPLDKHYTDPSQAKTIVPNRNLIFLSSAAAFALSHQSTLVEFACHAGDAAIYPDCRQAFVQAADCAMILACGVSIHAPFVSISKREIIDLGRKLAVPFELTYSCYLGEYAPCGRCGACIERKESGL